MRRKVSEGNALTIAELAEAEGAHPLDYFWTTLAAEVLPALTRTLMIWYCPDCHSGDPPLEKLPAGTIANVWGGIEYANESLRAGYPAVLSIARKSSFGSGWYLPPYGGNVDVAMWPGAYTRDPCA